MSMRLVNFMLSLMLGFILTNMSPATNVASATSFDKWLSDVEVSARAEGLSEETIKNLTGLKMDPEILALAARQPEYVKPAWEYLDTMVSDTRLNKGLAMLASNQAIFDKLEKTYGVHRYLLNGYLGHGNQLW